MDYKLIVDTMPKGFIAVLPDYPTFTVAAVSGKHSGLGTHVMTNTVGKPLLVAYPDTSEDYQKTGKSQLVEAYHQVLKTGQPLVQESMRYDVKDSGRKFKQKYWKTTIYPARNDSGEIVLLCSVSEDITERVVTNDKLIKAQNQLNEALSVGLVGTWQWNNRTNLIIGDQNTADMFVVDEDRLAEGMPITEFVQAIHNSDRPRLDKEFHDILKSKRNTFKSEYRTVRKDGSARWLLATGRVERDKHRKPLSFRGVLVDITDRKLIENNLLFLAQAGAALSASLDYKKTLQTIAKLVVPTIADWCTIDIVDDEGNIQQVALAHKDPAKVKWAMELRKQQGPPDLNEPTGLPKVLRTGEPEFYPEISDELLVASAKTKKELKLLREVGLSAVIIVPLVVDGKPKGAITMISAEQKRHYTPSDLDMANELARRASIAISNANLYKASQVELKERARLEEELRVANEELELRVEQRTAQLGETNYNLQRSNQELQDFAYVASHDLQEPLRKIQAFGNLLEDEYSKELGEGKDYLMRMRSAAARMSALIEDILAFSRVTTKARGFAAVNLNTIVDDVLSDLETRIEDTKASIKVDALPTIQADPMQMRQLCQNLISNALKFHRPGVEPVVKINAVTEISQTDKRKYCILSVADNGVGFDEKYRERIFAVFQRLHTRDAFEGTGIGLAVCRKIVERHGGTITATSKPGKGATFTVSLPVHHKKGETL